ncbi:MAG: hypothetical protein HQK66_03650 [Desulfamplus sp.]|nr:hypothetical protein [Desulfamplus sp.]
MRKNISETAIQNLNERWEEVLKQTEEAVIRRPDTYRELKSLANRILFGQLDIGEYIPTAKRVVHLLRELDPGDGTAEDQEPGDRKPGDQESENQEPKYRKAGDQEPENQEPKYRKAGDQEPGDRKAGGQITTIFNCFVEPIEPSDIWHLRWMRVECADLMDHLAAFDQWRRDRRCLRVV